MSGEPLIGERTYRPWPRKLPVDERKKRIAQHLIEAGRLRQRGHLVKAVEHEFAAEWLFLPLGV